MTADVLLPSIPFAVRPHGQFAEDRRNADPHWYQRAIVYQVHVRSFFDANEDGIGDFAGLIQKLDYVQDLGATAIWLMPFYPSPLKDDGYDISEFRDVHPAYGTLRDFKRLLRDAHRRGLRVITELVLNHTSNQHPWFQRARRAPSHSRWRDFYVWSDTSVRFRDARIIFPDDESSNWTWDSVAGAYYWHRFYHHQPDLNYNNPEVQRAMLQVLDFWLRFGVDGVRLNAVPYLFERDGTNCENLPETHAFIRQLRRHVEEKYHGRLLLADANQWPEDAASYFGTGDECHAALHFPLMPRMYMALHTEDRGPIVDILRQTPSPPDAGQWFLFLRNHDELTLEMVTEEERTAMYRYYARDVQARVHRGIRRRLAPLLENNLANVQLLTALMLALPGTPVIYYGDELGMGDNIYLGDRNSVRTPMQWTADRNAGFSQAPAQRLYLPVISDPPYSFEAVNVEAQMDHPHSLLSWTRQALALRRGSKALTEGTIEYLEPANSHVMAYLRHAADETVLVVANLSRQAQAVQLDLTAYTGREPVEMFGQASFPPIGQWPYLLTLTPRAFFWLHLRAPQPTAAAASAFGHSLRTGPRPMMIQVSGEWQQIFEEPYRVELEKLLPAFLRSRRWFGGKARTIRTATILDLVPMRILVHDEEVQLAVIQVQYSGAETERYLVPLSAATEEQIRAHDSLHVDAILAAIRVQQPGFAHTVMLYDVFGEPAFNAAFLELIAARRTLAGREGKLKARTSPVYRQLRGPDNTPLPAKALKAETSNSTLVYGDRFMLKLFRKLDDGINPELEIGSFLTDEVAFAHVPPVAGALEYVIDDSERLTAGLLAGFVPNEGSAWPYTLSSLATYFEGILQGSEVAHAGDDVPPRQSPLELAHSAIDSQRFARIGDYLHSADLLGRRTAEMHVALATDTGNPRFTPEPFTRHYQRGLYQNFRNQMLHGMQFLGHHLESIPEQIRPQAVWVLSQQDQLLDRLQPLLGDALHVTRTRCHGDYHLGQVLYTGSDFVIIDFEGEPARPIAERQIKSSPLRDVAGMLRSFDYACCAAHEDLVSRLVIEARQEERLQRWVRYWVAWVSAAFLRSYLAVATGSSFVPKRPQDLAVLLNAYLLEKAMYELIYELNNRPTWASIPLGGIVRLLETS